MAKGFNYGSRVDDEGIDVFKEMQEKAIAKAQEEKSSSDVILTLDKLVAFSRHDEAHAENASEESIKESIKHVGQLEKILVRKHPSKKGKYEILSGHTRVKCLAELGINTVKCDIVEMDDDLADYTYISTNEIRRRKLPLIAQAEDVAAIHAHFQDDYKKHPAKYENFDAREMTAIYFRVSGSNIQNYLDIAELEPSLKKLVGTRIKKLAAAKASKLSKPSQRLLAEEYNNNADFDPSPRAILNLVKKETEKGSTLTASEIIEGTNEGGNTIRNITITAEARKYIPNDIKDGHDLAKLVCELLKERYEKNLG